MQTCYFAALIRCWSSVLISLVPLLSGLLAAPLTLHPERLAATDLALSGLLTDVPAGEVRYVRWADLRALPSIQLRPNGEYLSGAEEITVVLLSELWRALPRNVAADTLLATCNDGYASVYEIDLIVRCRPFLILEINGLPPDRWPPPGMQSNPGPYVIWLTASFAPEVAGLLDPAHKKPWGVISLEVASRAERFRDAFAGRWAALSNRAAAGRTIWIDSCASCHTGPGSTFGGTKGGVPFAELASHAQFRPEYFKQYIRTPKALKPDAKMTAHSHYTDSHIAAILAFVAAEPPGNSASKISAP